jgi:hypothetical protein
MVVGGTKVEDVVDGDVVVDGHGASVVELLEDVGPVIVVGGVVVNVVLVLPGGSVTVVVVVAVVVVVVPVGGTVGHPSEPAIDANSGAAPGRLANAACNDRSNPQIGSRVVGSSCAATRPPTTGDDPAAGVPTTSAAHTRRPILLRRSLATTV